MGVNICLMGSNQNPNKVILSQQSVEVFEDCVKLMAYPGCCPGEYTNSKDDDGTHTCSCGASTLKVQWWEAWFYLTEMTVEVLPEWIHYWTGIEQDEVKVDIKWES